MRGQNLDAVLELESLQTDSFASDEETKLSDLGFELPTGPAQPVNLDNQPVNLDNLSALEKLEALAMLELDQQKKSEEN
jgi:hypothetical protein